MNPNLYVGNLSFDASEEDLRKLFSEIGEVRSAKIVMDMYSGRPKGFGFVEMATPEEAEKAITQLNGKAFMNRNLIVNEARPQKKRGEFKGGNRNRRR